MSCIQAPSTQPQSGEPLTDLNCLSLQGLFASRPQSTSANESQASLLAQLQAGLQARGALPMASNGSQLSGLSAKHRTLSDVERMGKDHRLISPHGSQVIQIPSVLL